MIDETNRIIAELRKLGFEDPACELCEFFHREPKIMFGTCNHPLAVAIKSMSEAIRESQGGHDKPLFPIVIHQDEEGSSIEIPALVASPIGIAAGSVKWPEFYDPIHIRFCVLYNKKDGDTTIKN